jgi:hypothetical protein
MHRCVSLLAWWPLWVVANINAMQPHMRAHPDLRSEAAVLIILRLLASKFGPAQPATS